ncbi:threonine--tRNA ligase [Candidatus Micrarchaeota archaeon]|nr:threonine--tRNA ligase [Candidatus Micrarchaeota archaeon]
MKIMINGTEVEVDGEVVPLELLKGNNAQKYLAVRCSKDGKTFLFDLNLKINVNDYDSLEFITFDDPDGKKVYWHTSAHVLAQAVKELFPNAKLTIGPAIENGFYYDIDHDPFTPEDLVKIEEKMKEIIKRDIPLVREEVTVDKARELFKDNPYKIEMIDEVASAGGQLSIYKQGDFYDLCRGPHLPSTGYIGAVKVTKVSGAYWRGDAKNKQLQRIYGIAFPTPKELRSYLNMLEEAARRDHRKIGKELDLFSLHEEGPGFPFWHPKGMVIYNSIIEYYRGILRRENYQEVRGPIILNRSLWERSGHWDHYHDNMYFLKIDGVDYAVKPMNCPGHVLIYKTKVHSYKEFPIKLAEFGLVHRHEMAGVLHGLFRVRAFTQDDAHVFCLPEQIETEIIKLIDLVFEMYKTFGFEDVHVELSTRPNDYMGELDLWNRAESSLKSALDKKGIKYKINEGDGAFYGPKIDFHIKDCMGRSWQCGTIQLDFAMPETLDITYMGPDGTMNHRPVMLHRAILGSIERFIGMLLEHYAGKLPLWLSPVQVKIIPVSESHVEYADKLRSILFDHRLRVEVDDTLESVSKKVRNAQMEKVNYMLVVGDKEVESNTVSVRTRNNKVINNIKIDDLVAKLVEEVDAKSVEPLIK